MAPAVAVVPRHMPRAPWRPSFEVKVVAAILAVTAIVTALWLWTATRPRGEYLIAQVPGSAPLATPHTPTPAATSTTPATPTPTPKPAVAPVTPTTLAPAVPAAKPARHARTPVVAPVTAPTSTALATAALASTPTPPPAPATALAPAPASKPATPTPASGPAKPAVPALAPGHEDETRSDFEEWLGAPLLPEYSDEEKLQARAKDAAPVAAAEKAVADLEKRAASSRTYTWRSNVKDARARQELEGMVFALVVYNSGERKGRLTFGGLDVELNPGTRVVPQVIEFPSPVQGGTLMVVAGKAPPPMGPPIDLRIKVLFASKP